MDNNYHKPLIKVRHQDLILFDPTNSQYKTNCPVCENGILPMRRDPDKDFQLEASDMCLGCGQHFRYTDIRRMRNLEKSK